MTFFSRKLLQILIIYIFRCERFFGCSTERK